MALETTPLGKGKTKARDGAFTNIVCGTRAVPKTGRKWCSTGGNNGQDEEKISTRKKLKMARETASCDVG